ncbi:hypothetical protein IMCC20628_03485 [Hoeflea sp. IMCC20628]|uniref:hypothetical protein n=1 Tax=Hoeflea sp. IMCC20628 TaxID=1620421 RepID=UPI00063A9809|nr:hypothetical protein [Hoeflea sp. IMCC20628]AKI02174.1 hypothetical protein IMCC20628_03485 [Hoeflea sp. IMCC20628]
MKQPPYVAGKGPDEPLHEVMARISSELVDVADLIERLEPLLSNGGSTELLASPDHMRVLQGIDLAVQKSRGLAAFIDSVGEGLEAELMVNITSALNLLNLEDMKRQLKASTRTAPSTEIYQKASGDLEFF